MRFLPALTILFSISAWAQNTAAPAKPANKGQVVADIAGKKITLAEFNSRYEQNSQLVPGAPPPKSEVLKNIVYFELATKEARRLSLQDDPSIKEQFDILLYQTIVRRFVQPKIDALDVSESEVRKFYTDSPLVKTNHIILLSKPGMTEAESKALKTKAQEILATVRASKKPFEDLARQYSEGPSANTGGDVVWGARHKLLPEYYEAALALKNNGDISEVVETPYGFHIIKLTGKKPFAELDSVYRDFIIRTIRENKGQGLFNAYFEDLRKKYKVVVNEDLIK
jgi:peptidyl-prolyl cis-trans isomerase C/peptidyl-prolyl cis-trans isomerase D